MVVLSYLQLIINDALLLPIGSLKHHLLPATMTLNSSYSISRCYRTAPDIFRLPFSYLNN